MTDSDQSGDMSINRVAIKTPPFWRNRPALWFATLEAQFHINQVTREETKFYYAVAHLDTSTADEVEEIITAPPHSQPYTTLKNALIHRFAESYDERIRKLMEREEMGDRKPSSFLRHLRSLSTDGVPDKLLKSIWISRLPQQMQSILVTQPKASLEELGDLADKLHEISNTNTFHTHAVSNTNHTNDTASQLQQLQQAVADLTTQVASLTASGSRIRNNPRSRSRSKSRHRGLCWYHSHYAEKAQKCTSPCTWVNKTRQTKPVNYRSNQ